MPDRQPETENLDEAGLRRQLGKARDELREKERLLGARELKIRQLEQELDEVIHSRVWRAADFCRCIVRGQIFRASPLLEQKVGPAAGRWVRRYLKTPLTRAGLLRDEYSRWLKNENRETSSLSVQDMREAYPLHPLVSIIMPVYNVRPAWLRRAVDSVRRQAYPAWELCIADDCSTDPEIRRFLQELADTDDRVRVRFLERNTGIAGASNAALAMATGEFVGFLDHDDELSPDALLEVVRALNERPETDFFYSDEDKITEKGKRYHPFFKPGWAPDTLRSYNYLCHFSVIRRSVVGEVGGFREGYEGSQDYDLFLRVVDRTDRIVHIPKILYHWRAIEGSVGRKGSAKMYAYESARKALADHLARNGLQGEVRDGLFLGSYHIRYEVAGMPEVAIIIPTRDRVDVLRRCIESIIGRSTYENYRILVVDNGSAEERTHRYYGELCRHERVTLLEYHRPFNFSAVNNFAAARVASEYLLFLNNDTEIITPQWLEEMLGLAQRPDVGAVGCLLCYPNDTVQHGGIIIGIGGVAGHAHKYFPLGDYGYFGRLKTVQNLSAVTAACLLTRKSVFEEAGGFEEELSHAFNDVDLCLRIRERAYNIVYTPFAQLYHHESLSRGYENTPEKRQRFNRERLYCEERWFDILAAGDPYYNPNLTLTREDFSIRA
jgi:GT2 family glycosyltransferase